MAMNRMSATDKQEGVVSSKDQCPIEKNLGQEPSNFQKLESWLSAFIDLPRYDRESINEWIKTIPFNVYPEDLFLAPLYIFNDELLDNAVVEIIKGKTRNELISEKIVDTIMERMGQIFQYGKNEVPTIIAPKEKRQIIDNLAKELESLSTNILDNKTVNFSKTKSKQIILD